MMLFSSRARGRPLVPSMVPVSLPRYWGFYGDSQTEGTGPDANWHRPPTVFQAIWEASGLLAPLAVTVEGFSGRSLAGTRAAFDADTYAGTPWIHAQESGNQDLDGQRTAAEWGATFRSFMTSIATRFPAAVISYETAYNFRRDAEQWRNWDAYNAELDASIATLATQGVNVIKVDTNSKVLAAVAALGYETICYSDTDSHAYHYNPTGNLLVVLTMFDALGYDVASLNLTPSTVSAENKAALLSFF